jgi:lipopolysaccharide transport system ATP-binding protein
MRGTLEVSHVSKEFRIPARGRDSSLRELFSFGRFRSWGKNPSAPFLALDDVSFHVAPGNAVGIVGHNGSGKSTLLKLLTRIIKPTSGHIYTHGRVGALIEVGAGFHPDLTGRENTYLNGSILGLSRREVAARFDSIVAFAGLERYIDTPVKRYSSGMYMRLGFAIASHVDPDILLIDEVLAVGDTYFQNKCIRRMREFLTQGGTIIFVSHAMGQVAELCPECIWLDHGKAVYQGESKEAIARYMALVAEREQEELQKTLPEEWEAMQRDREHAEAERRAEDQAQRTNPDRPYLFDATILNRQGQPCTSFQVGEPLHLRITYRFGQVRRDPVLAFQIHRTDGLYMYGTSNHDHRLSLDAFPGEGEITLEMPSLNLNEGTYRIRLFLSGAPDAGDFSAFPRPGDEAELEFSVPAGQFAQGCTYLPVIWPSETRPLPLRSPQGKEKIDV